MDGSSKSPEVRVFISSTFRDLQVEREYLVKKVFPELRDLCHSRGVAFTEIDLRWGITEAEAEQGNIIRVCLDEIEQHRPYFIGILGSRYGTTPNITDPDVMDEMRVRYPWIEEAIRDEMSVTEMEIIHGVLNDPEVALISHFYFRHPLVDYVPPELARSSDPVIAEADARKLEALKAKIRAAGLRVRENFTDSEILGAWVREDLLRLINSRHPPIESVRLLDRERTAHEAFALTRRRSYVPHQKFIDELDAHANAVDEPLMIVGPSGAGKSSLLAYWAARRQEQYPDEKIVSHFVGSFTSDHGEVLRNIYHEIKEHFGIADEIPTQSDELERAFPLWLGKVQSALSGEGEDGKAPEQASEVATGKFILLLDAVNQLEGRGAELGWLPTYIPQNIRLVLSTTEGISSEAIRKRGWKELAMIPLEQLEREAIIEKFFASYRKSLSAEHTRMIASDPKTESPLFLRTLLEELRLFGIYELVGEQIQYLLAAKDLDDLFQRVLMRMEEDYGAGAVGQVMQLLWASRTGLAETELLAASGLSRLDLSRILLSLEYHLIRKEGKLSFFHDYLRKAVEDRYLATDDLQRGAHKKLAHYFSTLPVTERRRHEEPWQWQRAGELEKLKNSVASIPMFLEFGEEHQYELLGYWVALKGSYETTACYAESLAAYEASHASRLKVDAVISQLGKFYLLAGHYEAAEQLHRRALETREKQLGPGHALVTESLNDLGRVLQIRGKYQEAEEMLRRSLSNAERMYGKNHLEYAKVLDTLAELKYNTRDFSEAEPLFRETLRIREELAGKQNIHTLRSRTNLAASLLGMRSLPEAEQVFGECVNITREVLGVNHPDVATNLGGLAAVLIAQEKFVEALPLYIEAIRINTLAFGSGYIDVAKMIMGVGLVKRNLGLFREAEGCYLSALVTYESYFGISHLETAVVLYNLGLLYLSNRALAQAQEMLERCHAIRLEFLGADKYPTVRTMIAIAKLNKLQGNYERARAIYSQWLPLWEILEGGDTPKFLIASSDYQQVIDLLGP
jgi:nephrocystin-3